MFWKPVSLSGGFINLFLFLSLMSKEPDVAALPLRNVIDADAMVPGYLVRPYPFPEERRLTLTMLDALTRYPTLWGILGGGVFMGYAYLGGGAERLSGGDLSEGLPLLLEGVASFIGPTLAASAANKGIDSLTAALYQENSSFIQYPETGGTGRPTPRQVLDSKRLDVLGQLEYLASRGEKANETFRSAARANPYDLSSRVSLVEMGAQRFREGKETFEGLVEACYSVARAVVTMAPEERSSQRFSRPSAWNSLRSKWSWRSMGRQRDLAPQMALISINHVMGRHRSVIESVDDIVMMSRKEAMRDAEEGTMAVPGETAGLYGYLATLMRSVSMESGRQKGRARERERWLWEQVYLMALRDGEMSYPGESKNKVMMIDMPATSQEIIIKEYPGREQAEGEITLTKRINEVIWGRKEFSVPEPIATFSVTYEKRERDVTIWRLLPGETLYRKIQQGDPRIKAHKDSALSLLGLIHREIKPGEFGLKERDYAIYVKSWAEKAEVKGVFENGELKGYYLPIIESFKESQKVISLDPHAMNFFVLDDGRVAKIDNELQRSIPIQGELVRFLELFPYDPTRGERPGTPEHKGFMEDLFAYESGFGDLLKDDAFYLGYLNAVVDLSLSLYSPYSVRKEMAPLKKGLLFKCRNTLDIIASDFRSYHEKYKEEYAGLRRVNERMIKRNGFG